MSDPAPVCFGPRRAPASWTSLALSLVLALFLSAQGLAANYNDQAYQAAVADASVAMASEISRDLTPLVAWNTNLVWEGAPGASRLKMVALTGGYYDSSVGKNYVMSFGQLWVTAAPELKQFFQNGLHSPSVARLEQLLGLPPESGYTRIVEFWVNPSDLFRPSPDPETTDMEAQIGFPGGSRTSVPQSYQDWFAANYESSFHSTKPYPWTQLGYTYDWGASNHVGLSEFVIERGATVGVVQTYQPLDYLAARPQ